MTNAEVAPGGLPGAPADLRRAFRRIVRVHLLKSLDLQLCLVLGNTVATRSATQAMFIPDAHTRSVRYRAQEVRYFGAIHRKPPEQVHQLCANPRKKADLRSGLS